MSGHTNPEPFAAESTYARVPLGAFVRLFVAVMLPMFLAAIDQTLLATATPAIAREFNNLRDSAWIAIAYLLASTVMAPLYGRLGDRYGRSHALLAALGIFALGSAACAASTGMWWLIGSRVLQGLGGGGLMVMSQALIGETVPPRQRPRFQAYFGTVFVLASVLGPVLGGVVVSHSSWRWLFVVNLPLAAFAAWRVVAAGMRPAEPGAHAAGHDVPAVLLFAAAASLGLLWLTLAGHAFAWLSVRSAILACGALLAGWALLRRERAQSHPFLPLELLRLPAVAWTVATVTVFASAMFALVFFLPVYLQLSRHGSATDAGLLLLPLTLGLVVGSNLTGRVIARNGRPDRPPRYGMALAAGAIGLLGAIAPGPTGIAVLGLIAGLGFGTVMPSSQLLVQTVAGRRRLGAAAASIALARSTGAALGTAVFGAVVFGLASTADLQAALHTADAGAVQRVTDAFHLGFAAAALLTAIGAWVASRIPRVQI